MNTNEDIITAVSTPMGVGAISVIRISGSKSIEVVDRLFSGSIKLINSESHRIHYGKFLNSMGEVIDNVLISVFKNPNSYTGEDSLEISCHGSPYISEKIIKSLLETGIRIAEPGEFTKRAFLNGKMDLAQAEAVADLINSRAEASLKGARNQLDGLLSSKIDYLRSLLLNTSSLIELELDFAEEDIELISESEITKNIELVIDEIEKLLQTFSFGRVLRDGVNIAIVGKTNVGKSSLLNYLLKEARAIVSEIPGTTRDIIREEVTVDGLLFRLFDTAGIRHTSDEIETEGVRRSRDSIKNADLILFLNDILEGKAEDLYHELLLLTDKTRIITVYNKIDLDRTFYSDGDVFISAKTGEGIDKLFKIMRDRTFSINTYTESTLIISNIRHYHALQKARNDLQKAIDSIKSRLSGEFIAIDLKSAENSLNEIIGKITTDDILNNIFSKFCIGK